MEFQSKGLSGFNKLSTSSLQIALNFVPELVDNLKIASNVAENIIIIADYGCSEGKNSMITFTTIFKEFRTISDKPIMLIHTDLPENNWNIVCNTINNSEESYINMPNIYYNCVGRSFFNQLLPSNSVHMGYSSFAMHYFSKKPQRNEEYYGWAFPAGKIQGFADLTHLLTIRLKELINGGTFNLIINGREGEEDNSFAQFFMKPMKILLDQGIITNSEYKNYVWHSYPYNTKEVLQILNSFADKIEIIRCEHGKILFPCYAEYLETKNSEQYKNSIYNYMSVIMSRSVTACLERNEDEKNRILSLAAEYGTRMITDGLQEIFQDFIFVIIKKLK